MASRQKILFLILSAVLISFAVFFSVRYRLVRIGKLEVIDSEVCAILEKAADSLKVYSSSVRNTSLFVTTTENSICFDEDFPSALNLSLETTGYVKVKGINVFLDRLILEDGVPVAFSKTKKLTLFPVLSISGYFHDVNRCWKKDESFGETKVNGYFKYSDGQWNESTWEETLGEQEKKEEEQWQREHPDTLDFKSAIPSTFVEKYDSLTSKNFETFLKEWEQWSAKMSSISKDSLLNTILTKVYSEYSSNKEIDSCAFLSFSDNIEIRRYQGKANDYPANQEDVWQDRDEYWEYMMKASERYCYVPSINSDKEILYISPRIQRLLSLYIGGVCESEEDDFMDYEKWTKINEDRLSQLRRLIHVDRGHWGGYWHFKTMPIVFSIYLFEDGYVVDMRTSWCSGETVFYPFDPSKEKVVQSSWIE
ncbi:MAG: hypothetical protein IKX67_02440 [Bacteroidales bacterium]|nr:hypothetical protein [Bacteroidales bacterium]